MHTRYASFAFVLSLLSAANIHGETHKIVSMRQAQSLLQKADQNTLVIFDIDYTLCESCLIWENYVYRDFNSPIGTLLRKELKQLIDGKIKTMPHFRSSSWSKICQIFPVRLIEPETPHIIHDLQSRNIKVIALTAPPAQHFFGIEHMGKKRHEQLLSVGIDFSTSFEQQYMEFKDLKPFLGVYPAFHQGILYQTVMSGNSKGEVLGAFLDAIDWHPQQIIFFDDLKENVDSVEAEANKRSILFQGFWYQAPYKEAADPKNELIARTQMDHLKMYDVLLSDQEAEALMFQNGNTTITQSEAQK